MIPNNICRKKQKLLLIIISSIFMLIPFGCSRKKSSQATVVVAVVNGESIYFNDLMREIALKVEQDPSFRINSHVLENQLDTIIKTRLLIQEGMKQRLAEEERFINTIRHFWEQTLIRDLIDYKKTEWHNYIFVTEGEIKDYYRNLSQRGTFKILRSKDRVLLEELLKQGEPLEWEETIGPITCEDTNSEFLLKAFEMEAGETKIFADRDKNTYYLVNLAKKEVFSLDPLNELYSKIKDRLRGKKEQQAFEEWLREMTEKADIKINRETLSEETTLTPFHKPEIHNVR